MRRLIGPLPGAKPRMALDRVDDLVEQRYVELGQLSGDLRVILSGLSADDRVVIGDLWRATPGTKVTPKLTTLDEPGRNGQGGP